MKIKFNLKLIMEIISILCFIVWLYLGVSMILTSSSLKKSVKLLEIKINNL